MLRSAIIPRIFRRCFTVLAFESSADDTCVAVVHSSRKILSSAVIKQNDVHELYGGIYPKSAIEAHQRNLPHAIQKALSNIDLVKDIDGVAFTRGPGMPGCLSVGMNAAKAIAAALNKPLVGVHHMQGHALTPLLTELKPPAFPFLTLLVSGGHTLLLLATSLDSFKILATTQDESIGRTYDKVSRLLELKWTEFGPGHALETLCEEEFDSEGAHFAPIPPSMPGRLEFSFSGLHSQIQRIIQMAGGIDAIDKPSRRNAARVFQDSAVGQLEEKILLGFNWCKQRDIDVRHVVVSGGVASNNYLRQRLQRQLSSLGLGPHALVCPPASLCTDNAVMIAWASMHRFLTGKHDSYEVDLRPKWSIEDLPWRNT